MLNVEVANNCICIGNHAGELITDQDFIFAFTLTGSDGVVEEYSTVMTPGEFESVNAVVRRAADNKRTI